MVASRVCRRMNTFLSVWKGSLCNDRYRCSGVMPMRAIGGGRIGLGRGGGVYSVDGIRQIQCSGTKKGRVIVEDSVKEYWDDVLESVDRPSARKLLGFVDTSAPLGLPHLFDSSKLKSSRPPAFSFFYETKLQHPDKVVLVRVGEFYETIGIDAILMVQHAGLNPMGKEGNPPRAGCPRGNLRRTVSDMVEGGGLSVVVCEEAPEPYTYGTMRRTPKERYVAAIVTPAAPHFLHGMVDEEINIPVEKTPPLLGISPAVGGYSVIEVDAELMTVRETEGLTEDAVYSRLHEGGLVPPLYLHSPPTLADADTRIRDSIPEAEWKQRIGSIFRTQGTSLVRYSDPDAVAGMLERVKRHLGLPAEAEFTHLPSSSPSTRPRPLYFSTASNLGLHKTRGVPSLLDYALPSGAPLAARRWLRSLLLMPPAPHVSVALHQACAELWGDHDSLPNFVAMSPANVVLKLRKREGNSDFFNELKDLCHVVSTSCSTSTLEKMADSLLVVVAGETGVSLGRDDLATTAVHVSEAISAVVVDGSLHTLQHSPDIPDELDSLKKMRETNEDFTGKVKPEIIPEVIGQVEDAWNRLVIEAGACLALSREAVESVSDSTKKVVEPYLSYDVNNNAAWIKIPRGRKVSSTKAETLGLQHPRDRNGRIESSVYSTLALEEAQDEYRRSCVAAHDAVRDTLKELAASMSPNIPHLVGAATFSLIACVLESHVRESKRRNWALPSLVDFDASKTSRKGLHVRECWPYWLGGSGGNDPRVARNSFDMDGMFLVTGPNMAGKSTILRSTCAVALLGACGLAVPAAPETQIPYIDAFMLRNFSSDSPLEGRSSFAVEMTEMKYVLQDVTSRSLVLVDELGKGTEARAGSALAGAMLEALDKTGCIGAFATHLHDLLTMDLKLSENTTRMKMDIETITDSKTGEKKRRPTWRLVQGSSTESLALEVARECKLPENTLLRAQELYESPGSEGPQRLFLPSESEDDDMQQHKTTETIGTAECLQDLVPLFERTCTHVLERLKDDPPSFSIKYIPRGSLPGTSAVGRSCVYIARRPIDNRYYIGTQAGNSFSYHHSALITYLPIM
jgi:DNA mismatch repair ATPase MutS